MTSATQLIPGPIGDVLLLSTRRIEDLVAYCGPYEFEDVVVEVTGADLVKVDDRHALEFARRVYKWVSHTTRSRRLARLVAPPPSTVRLTRDYALFLPVFCSPYHLYALAAIPGWRKHCRKAACIITEAWSDQLPEYLLEQLADFDHIFVCTQNAVHQVAKLCGRPATYLPFAVNVLRFAPAALAGPRCIDVCNIGRRSDVTHRALLDIARDSRFFYYYDTVAASADKKQRTFRVDVPSEHRALLASLMRRSRYFLANRGRVNEPKYLAGRDEISARFYEGAAAGAIMLGEAPRNEEFRRQFDWPDAVIHMPFHSGDIRDLLGQLDANPDRQERIRRDSVFNSCTRHDWMHRLEQIFETVGVRPDSRFVPRREALEDVARTARAEPA